jgi:hypothetical protein
MNGVTGAAMQVIVVILVIENESIDICPLVLVAGMKLDYWYDRGHGALLLELNDMNSSLVALDAAIIWRVVVFILLIT